MKLDNLKLDDLTNAELVTLIQKRVVQKGDLPSSSWLGGATKDELIATVNGVCAFTQHDIYTIRWEQLRDECSRARAKFVDASSVPDLSTLDLSPEAIVAYDLVKIAEQREHDFFQILTAYEDAMIERYHRDAEA